MFSGCIVCARLHTSVRKTAQQRTPSRSTFKRTMTVFSGYSLSFVIDLRRAPYSPTCDSLLDRLRPSNSSPPSSCCGSHTRRCSSLSAIKASHRRCDPMANSTGAPPVDVLKPLACTSCVQSNQHLQHSCQQQQKSFTKTTCNTGSYRKLTQATLLTIGLLLGESGADPSIAVQPRSFQWCCETNAVCYVCECV